MWIGEREAKKLLGATDEEVTDLVERGSIVSFEVGGERLLRASDVNAFRADEGRPPVTNGRVRGAPARDDRPESRTLAEAALDEIGTAITGDRERFQEPGWEFDGETDVGCDEC